MIGENCSSSTNHPDSNPVARQGARLLLAAIQWTCREKSHLPDAGRFLRNAHAKMERIYSVRWPIVTEWLRVVESAQPNVRGDTRNSNHAKGSIANAAAL